MSMSNNRKKTVSDEEKKLAILLHDLLCHHNHADGCMWFYVKDDNDSEWETEYSRAKYLNMARVLLSHWNSSKSHVFAIPYVLNELQKKGSSKMVDGKLVFDNSFLFKD